MREFVTGCVRLVKFEILFLIFEVCNYAQLSNFVPFRGLEVTL